MKRLAIAALGLTLLAGAAAAQTRYSLPPGIRYPEGLSYDAKSGAFYTAGSPDGTIARVDARTGETQVIPAPGVAAQIGTTFPGILGVRLDSRGRLWLAGGRTGKVFVIDPRTGALIQTITPPDAAKGLINDIAFAGGRAFMTDTLRPTMWAADAGAKVPPTPEAWIDFAGTPLEYAPGANLNGVVATPDGTTLIAVQMNKGLLFRIDVASRKVTPIDMKGETAPGADGLVLSGDTLYVIRQPDAEIVTIRLARDLASGTVVARNKAEGLLWPANGAVVGNELLVVNTQFNKRGTGDPQTPFSIERVPLAKLAGR